MDDISQWGHQWQFSELQCDLNLISQAFPNSSKSLVITFKQNWCIFIIIIIIMRLYIVIQTMKLLWPQNLMLTQDVP